MEPTRPRQSGRTTVPSQKVREAASSSRSSAGVTEVSSFRALGDQHAKHVTDLSEEDPRSGGSDAEIESAELPVASTRKVEGQGKPVPAAKRSRKSSKWSLGQNSTLVAMCLQHRVWSVSGETPVTQKWDDCISNLSEPPHNITFKGKTKSQMIAHLDYLLKETSKAGTDANRASGIGNEDSGSEDEPEKRMKAELDNNLQAIVDAKCASKLNKEATRKSKDAEKSGTTALGRLAISQGNSRCGPGAKSTSFGDAMESDAIAFASAQSQRSDRTSRVDLAGGSSGPSTPPTMGEGVLRLPALGDHLSIVMHAPLADVLAAKAGSTPQEAEFFLESGGELRRDSAVAMMRVVIEGKLFARRGYMTAEDYVDQHIAAGEGHVEIPGMSESALSDLCSHYSADAKKFYGPNKEAHKWYVVGVRADGGKNERAPKDTEYDAVTRTIAEALVVTGCEKANEASSTSDPSSAEKEATPRTVTPNSIDGAGSGAKGSTAGKGPSRETSGGDGNRGRKTRRNGQQLEEGGLDGLLQDQMKMMDARAKERDATEELREERKEARKRKEREYERQTRLEETKIRVDAERVERLAERQLENQERDTERTHERRMLELQVQLQLAKNREQPSM